MLLIWALIVGLISFILGILYGHAARINNFWPSRPLTQKEQSQMKIGELFSALWWAALVSILPLLLLQISSTGIFHTLAQSLITLNYSYLGCFTTGWFVKYLYSLICEIIEQAKTASEDSESLD
jgi:uncharacterized membrane protein